MYGRSAGTHTVDGQGLQRRMREAAGLGGELLCHIFGNIQVHLQA
jgi:hypothetical protein